MKTMYEIHWHYVDEETKDDVFTHCTVTPITVIREGILPGCTGVSITAIDSEGRKFQGSPRDYYNTEQEAWVAVKSDIEESVLNYEQSLAIDLERLAAMKKYLALLEEQK